MKPARLFEIRLDSRQQELLRWLAMAIMVVDHIGYLFIGFADAGPWRAVGRIAWPVFAFLMAYNVSVRKTDPLRYLAPLAIFTVLAQIPHWLAFSWLGVSIMGTLFLGAATLALLIRRNTVHPALWLLLPVILFAAQYVEYGLAGVLLIVLLWLALETRSSLAWLPVLGAMVMINYPWALWPYAFLSLPLAWLVARLPIGLPRSGVLPWIFYPAHLLVLVSIRALGG